MGGTTSSLGLEGPREAKWVCWTTTTPLLQIHVFEVRELNYSFHARVKTVVFSGTVQITPLTQPVNITIAGKTITSSLLCTKNTPINLLGRDILCPLKAIIACTHNGLGVDFPSDVTHIVHEPKSKMSLIGTTQGGTM